MQKRFRGRVSVQPEEEKRKRENWHGVPELAAQLSKRSHRPIKAGTIYKVLEGYCKSARALEFVREAEKILGVKVLRGEAEAA